MNEKNEEAFREWADKNIDLLPYGDIARDRAFGAWIECAERKDAEIEQLKQYACQCEASVHSTQEGYAQLQAEIERLKAANTDLGQECLKRGMTIADMQRLITRAADALEMWQSSGWYYGSLTSALIAELRKAAE